MNRKQIKKWLYGKCPGYAGRFPYFGTTIHFPKDSEIFQRVCDEGVFEAVNLNVISSVLAKDTFYIDAGTNIGLMSVPVLQRFDTCQVLSFEPSPTTLPFLLKTHANCAHKSRWHIRSMAAGSQVGQMTFYTAAGGRDAYEGMRDTKRGGDKHPVTVSVTTIDKELSQQGNPPVSVIKIDVEGAELQVLGGAVECLRRDHPFVLLEWNHMNLKAFDNQPEDLLSWANKSGYEIFTLPRLLHVQSAAALKLYMTFTESFLLVSGQADLEHVRSFEFMNGI